MNSSPIKVSIIIRTYNEGRWMPHCLGMIFEQYLKDFEVIIVDNNSTDNTIEVAKRYPVSKIINIDKFLPGKAINSGILVSSGEYIVCLSAHCIPKDKHWLSNLYQNFIKNDKLAGVYGRQLPVSYTGDSDKRDLLITFGRDRKLQVKDYFFHNANSMISRAIWEMFPFDEKSTNIEDRIWGKNIINAGYDIVYDPGAAVYHYHGLHQHSSSSERAKGIAAILDELDGDIVGNLPESMKPENAYFVAIVPVLGSQKNVDGVDLLQQALNYLKDEKYINSIYILGDVKSVEEAAIKGEVNYIKRPDNLKDSNISLEEVLKYCLSYIENSGIFPEGVMYINYLFPFRPVGLIDTLIFDLQYKGLDTAFSSYVDYGNYWKESSLGNFSQIGESLIPRGEKHPLHRALYGVGCATLSSTIRSKRLIGDNVGIYPLDNLLYTLRVDKETPIEIISSGIKNFLKKDFSKC